MKRVMLYVGLIVSEVGVVPFASGFTYYLVLIPQGINYGFSASTETYPETFDSLIAVGVLLLLVGAGLVVGAIGEPGARSQQNPTA